MYHIAGVFHKCKKTKLAEPLVLILYLSLICAMCNWHCHREDLNAAETDSEDDFNI